MLKDVLNVKGVRQLRKVEQVSIHGGANYLCWNGNGDLYDSDDDISQYVEGGNAYEQLHCVPTAVVSG